jgi:hypothetical protein
MAMVCSRCQTVHEQLLKCPGCGDRLHYPEAPRQVAAIQVPADRWQDSTWGRIFVGLLLSQGFFYALRHLSAGLMLAFEPPTEPAEDASVLFGLVLSQVLQAGALLVGAGLIGSGQRHGAALGAVVGVWNGVLAGLAPRAAGQPFSAVALYGDPLLQTMFGALAGWVGSVIWEPLPALEPRGPRRAARRAPPRPKIPLFAGKIAYIRVTLGTIVAVAGAMSAASFLGLIAQINESDLATGATVLDQLVTWEVKALALLAGGVLAGSNSYNGLKQGLCAGIASGLIVAAVEPHAHENWFEMVGLFSAGSVAACMIGGWFGSIVFPPVSSRKRHSFESSSLV